MNQKLTRKFMHFHFWCWEKKKKKKVGWKESKGIQTHINTP